jgi:hypothetical protein
MRWIAEHLAPDGVAFIAAYCPGGKYPTPEGLSRLVSKYFDIEKEQVIESDHAMILARKKRTIVAVTVDYETWDPVPDLQYSFLVLPSSEVCVPKAVQESHTDQISMEEGKMRKVTGFIIILLALAFCQASGQEAAKITRPQGVLFKSKTICVKVDTIWGWSFRPVNVEMMMPVRHQEENYYPPLQGWMRFNIWRAVRIMQIDSVFEERSENGWIVSMQWHRRTWFEDGKKFIPEGVQFFLSDDVVMKPDTLRMSR